MIYNVVRYCALLPTLALLYMCVLYLKWYAKNHPYISLGCTDISCVCFGRVWYFLQVAMLVNLLLLCCV